MFSAATLIAIRLLWYFNRWHSPCIYLMVLTGFGLLFVGIDYVLAIVGIERPARSGMWVSATTGLYVSAFLPCDLDGFVKELIVFSALILSFGLVYVLDRWLTGYFERRTRNDK